MQHRITLVLFSALALAFAGCADHAGSPLASGGPSAPINDPDTHLLPNPGENTGAGAGQSGSSGGTGAARNAGGSSTGSGGTSGTGEPGATGEPSTGNQSGGGSNPGSGGQAGSPVPEPGTLLLFGTGLAGLAGASFRRRRRKD